MAAKKTTKKTGKPSKKPAKKPAKVAAKKAPPKKAVAKKAPAKKAPAKAIAKKTIAKKTVAKKAPAKKVPAKKAPPKKADKQTTPVSTKAVPEKKLAKAPEKPVVVEAPVPAPAEEPEVTTVDDGPIPVPAALYRLGMGLSALCAIKGLRFRKFSVLPRDTFVAFVMDRGNGDELRVFFTRHGHLIRGFDHESERSPYRVGHVWPGMYRGLPEALRFLVELPAGHEFDGDLFGEGSLAEGRLLPVTCAAWWTPGAAEWTRGPLAGEAPDGGMDFLLSCLDASIDYVEQGWHADTVARVLRNEPLGDSDIARLQAGVDIARVRRELATMGYGAPPPLVL